MPAIVDLAAMRDAMADLGGDPSKINPLVPAELVIDHSVQVDAFGSRDAFRINAEREFERNQERYAFLRWGQTAFEGFVVVPPDTGIVHQVNLEYLARVVFENEGVLYPDTLVGHRLAHDDDQRPRRARLGRRRHRGRGGDARPGDVDADPARGRLQARRRAARGRDRDRPRAHRHAAAARARRGRQVRRVLRPRHPEHAAGRPGDDRQHEPGVRLHVRDLPDRRRDDPLHALHRPLARSSARSSRPTRASRACGTTRTPRSRRTPRRWSSTSATSCPSLAGPKRPQDRVVADRVQGRVPARARAILPDAEDEAEADEPGVPGHGTTATPTSTRSPRSPSRPPTRRRTTATAPGTDGSRAGRTAAPAACRSPSARSTTST